MKSCFTNITEFHWYSLPSLSPPCEMDVSSQTFKDVSEHHRRHFCMHFYMHGEPQSSTVPGDRAQGLGASERLGEGCKVNTSSPCCLYHCLRSTPLFRCGTFLSITLASSPCGLYTSATGCGLKPGLKKNKAKWLSIQLMVPVATIRPVAGKKKKKGEGKKPKNTHALQLSAWLVLGAADRRQSFVSCK